MSPSHSYPDPSCGISSPQILRAPYSNGDVAYINLVQHHAKAVNIAYPLTRWAESRTPLSQNLAGNVWEDNATADVGTHRKYEETIAD